MIRIFVAQIKYNLGQARCRAKDWIGPGPHVSTGCAGHLDHGLDPGAPGSKKNYDLRVFYTFLDRVTPPILRGNSTQYRFEKEIRTEISIGFISIDAVSMGYNQRNV